ncbi:MAG: glycoside hydrolase family 3 protein [Clostridiales bacterium]|nr:glycoside hydrolase family 3 protein [Clostridiales bacterium]
MITKDITSGGIRIVSQEGGPDLGLAEGSGVSIIEQDGLFFKDHERTGTLLPYEDWRLPAKERAKDLSARMTIEEIAGLMLYSSHQMVPPRAGMPFRGTYGGKEYEEAGVPPYALSDQQKLLIQKDHIRHILMSAVRDADTSARWSNALQALAEAQPHAIPVNISSDPRSGARHASAEYKNAGSDVSRWPEGIGFASCFDPDVVRQFAHDASIEYRALGITTALGPQIDLSTEPRWMRLQDTLGSVTEDVLPLVRAYCDGMQTTEGASDGWGRESVNTMVKHWPGGGTGEGGRDAHYPFGAYAVYPSGNAAEHMKPFTEAAFRLDGPTKCASAVMPYYTVSWGFDDTDGQNVGNSYSRNIITQRLRGEAGFDGIICTDWGITGDPAPVMDSFGSRCYNVQNLTTAERHLRILMNGVDQFGGNNDPVPLIEAYRIGCERYGRDVMDARFRESAARLLVNIFHCGLFEDPYLDPAASARIVGNEEFRRHGYEAQLKSVVLLKNKGGALPLKEGLKVYVPGRRLRATKSFFRSEVPAREDDPVTDDVIARYGVRVPTPEEADVAIVFAESPASDPYSPEDAASGGNGYLPLTLQYRPYTATEARKPSIAGGDFRESFTDRSYRGKTNIAVNESDLDNILDTRRAMAGKPVIVVETMNNPMVVSEFEAEADAIVAEFGVSREAVLDIVFGRCQPRGRLPFQLPRDMATVEQHAEDRALDLDVYTDEQGNAYDYGFGIGFDGKRLG